jgi:hypothetical protein
MGKPVQIRRGARCRHHLGAILGRGAEDAVVSDAMATREGNQGEQVLDQLVAGPSPAQPADGVTPPPKSRGPQQDWCRPLTASRARPVFPSARLPSFQLDCKRVLLHSANGVIELPGLLLGCMKVVFLSRQGICRSIESTLRCLRPFAGGVVTVQDGRQIVQRQGGGEVVGLAAHVVGHAQGIDDGLLGVV